MQLRPYQTDNLNAIHSAWAAGHRNVLSVLPTGSGKTVIFSEAIRLHNGPSVAIAHRQELVGQMSMALARDGVRHRIIGDTKVVKAVVTQHTEELGRDFYNPSAACAVAGVDTIMSWSKPDNRHHAELTRWANGVTLWVVDESHHPSGCSTPGDFSTGNKWCRAINLFPNAKGLGVTATPVRADGKGLSRKNDGVFDHMVEGPGMRDLITAGYLTDYRIFCPPSDLDLSAVATGADGDYIRGQLALKTRKSSVMGDVIAHYKRWADGKLGVTFAPDVESATEFAAAFNAAGVPAAVVSAKTPDLHRRAVLKQFRQRKILQLVNVDLFGEGFDLPAIEVVSMARATQSYALYSQQFGRALRLMEGKERACIAEGELVLTDQGLVEIQNITLNHKLWDGVEWVSHQGIIYKGEKEVIQYDGLTATRDHLVKTKKGWQTFGWCSDKQVGIIKTGDGWTGIRECENRFSRNKKISTRGGIKGTCLLSMYQLFRRKMDFLYESKRGSNQRLQKMQSADKCSEMVVFEDTRCGTALQQSKESNVEKLRCERNTFQLRDNSYRCVMGTRTFRVRKTSTIRQDRQQRSLRTRELALVNTGSEHESYNEIKVVSKTTRFQIKISSCKVCRLNISSSNCGVDRGRNTRKMAPTLVQTKRSVWDILNAGPRNCFTVSDLLVHNCIIDHVGNVARHGLPDRPRIWTLDRREKRSSNNDLGTIPIRTCLNPVCLAPYEAIYPECPFCGFKPVPAGRTAPEMVEGDLCELDAATLAVMRGEIAKVNEHPDNILHMMQRAGHAYPIAKGAANRHAEKQEAQGLLREAVAWWAGHRRAAGDPDAVSYRRFYHLFGTDVLSAQALGRADAELLTEKINRSIGR